MQIVGRSEDYTSTDPALNPPIVEGQKNPMRRDTVQVPSMHSATLRVIADNPGVWFFHCSSPLSNCAKMESTFTDIPGGNRPYRVAFASRSRYDLPRGSFADSGACQRCLPAVHYRPMRESGYPRVRQRCRSLGSFRPHWPTEWSISTKQRLARQGNRRNVWVGIIPSSLLPIRCEGG